MKLSRTVSYALQATLQLAQSASGEPIPCCQLAAGGKMPERFLLQILRMLVAQGILESTRGADGGYSLDRPAEQITLLEVIEAVEGPLVASLPAGEGLPQETWAKLEQIVLETTNTLRRQLQAISLADLLPEPLVAAASQGGKAVTRSGRIRRGVKISVRGPASKVP